MAGPSPLARGTRADEDRRRRAHGTIPARAGNTRPWSVSTRRGRDHPRSRGEHRELRDDGRAHAGPSPLARGTPQLVMADPRRPGTIPARAGNTVPRARARRGRPDHPRSRGEHVEGEGGHHTAPGPSPLARGTRALGLPPDRDRRTIPARAGNTSPAAPRRPGTPDHPRSRGEHMTMADKPLITPGPSPLARGTPPRPPTRPRSPRTIPARAGNTRCHRVRLHPEPDHPRSRGEHPGAGAFCRPAYGPSPLARGTREPDLRHRDRVRTIPARAGNTRKRCSRSTPSRDHPRSRGEHSWPSAISSVASGPSPLARGTRGRCESADAGGGTIPARAGNT